MKTFFFETGNRYFSLLEKGGLLALGGLTLVGCTSQPKQPNIVLIVADDIGYGDLECNGETTIHTPNVNQLASEGVRLTNCHATSATSTPSRYGMLTGMYPWRREGTGIAAGDAAMIIRPEQTTVADMFRDAGYVTAAVGKWHLGLGDEAGKQDWNGVVTPNLSDIGFDYSYIMAATADRVPCVYIENGRVVNLDPSDPIEVSYTTPFEGEPTGAKNPELLRLHPSHGHDMAVIDGISRIGFMRGGKSALWHDEDIADNITDHALNFIKENKDKPFFLYFGTNDIHVPRVPNERFVGKSGMGARGDAILSFDYCVGRVMEILKANGLDKNTIVILTSDNGPVVDDGYADRAVELLGEHRPWGDYRGGKYSIFEAGTRVPCIVRWQGTIKPTVSDAAVSLVDLFATLAQAIGLQVPQDAASDSEPQWAAWCGTDTVGRACLVEQNLHGTLGIITDGWKYIQPSMAPAYNRYTATELGNNPETQLYDLHNDRHEEHNVASQYPDRVKKMAEQLQQIVNAESGI